MRAYDAVIFDLGGVLTVFDPLEFACRIKGSTGDALRLKRAVFGTRTWLDLDQGLLTEEEARARIVADNPEEADAIRDLFDRYKDFLLPIPEGVAILERVKRVGLRAFALSNFGAEAWKVVRARDAYFALFDGIIVSSQEKLLKPDPAIFHLLLDRYSLEPKRCIYTDDAPMNVEVARSLGIVGIHFENHPQLLAALTKRGIFDGEG
jgi:epoxide hydrolase-like predicted phosphatase